MHACNEEASGRRNAAHGYAIQPVHVQLRRPRLDEDGRSLDWGDRLQTIVALPGNRVALPRKAHTEVT